MGWVLDTVNQDIYTEDSVKDNLHVALEAPYPSVFWFVDENDIKHNGEVYCDTPCFTAPFPSIFWYVNETSDDVVYNGELDYEEMGSFLNTKHLTEIKLPNSLLSIGPFAFAGSGIRKVVIPNHACTFYSTSFPPECEVTGGNMIDWHNYIQFYFLFFQKS